MALIKIQFLEELVTNGAITEQLEDFIGIFRSIRKRRFFRGQDNGEFPRLAARILTWKMN